MLTTIRGLYDDNRAQGLAEYGLILGFIAVACVVAVVATQVQISALLTRIAHAF